MKKTQKLKGNFNVPNCITALRLFFALIMLGFAWYSTVHNNPIGSLAVILVLFVLIVFSDWIDGLLARKLQMETGFGKIFDQIVDKVAIDIILIFLATQHIIFFIFPILFITRDLLVNGIRIYKAEQIAKLGIDKESVIIPTSPLARIKTGVLFICILLIFLILIGTFANYDKNHPQAIHIWEFYYVSVNHHTRVFLYNYVLIVPLILAIWSCFNYAYTNLTTDKQKNVVFATMFGALKKPTARRAKVSLSKFKNKRSQLRSSRTDKMFLDAVTKPSKPNRKRTNHHDLDSTTDNLNANARVPDTETFPSNNSIESDDHQNLLLNETIRHDLRDSIGKINMSKEQHFDNFEKDKDQFDRGNEKMKIVDYVDDNGGQDTENSQSPKEQPKDKYQTVDNEEGTSSDENSNEEWPKVEQFDQLNPKQDFADIGPNNDAMNIPKNGDDSLANPDGLAFEADQKKLSDRSNRRLQLRDQNLDETMSDLFINPKQIVDYVDDNEGQDK